MYLEILNIASLLTYTPPSSKKTTDSTPCAPNPCSFRSALPASDCKERNLRRLSESRCRTKWTQPLQRLHSPSISTSMSAIVSFWLRSEEALTFVLAKILTYRAPLTTRLHKTWSSAPVSWPVPEEKSHEHYHGHGWANHPLVHRGGEGIPYGLRGRHSRLGRAR